MIRLSILIIALLFSSCSMMTVIRTKELKKVESHLELEIDSLKIHIDSLMRDLRRAQNRTNADIRLILSSMAKNNEAIKARLEETQFRLDKINEKSDSILTQKPELVIVPADTAPAVPVAVDSAQAATDAKLLNVYEQAREDFNNKDYKNAYSGFKDVYVGHSDKAVAENALFWLAACFEESGKHEGAIKNYQRLFAEFPTGKKLCMGKLKLAYLADKLGNKDLKMETLKSLISDSHCSGSGAVMQAEEMLK